MGLHVEATRIVAKIEASFAQTDAIEAVVNIARQRADAKRSAAPRLANRRQHETQI